MKETVYYCDHCASVLNTKEDYPELTIELNHIEIKTDLCTDCFDRLVTRINDFCKKE